MKVRAVVAVLLSGLCANAVVCITTYGTDLHGHEVTAPNSIVANLLFDYANALAIRRSVEQATTLYEMAGEYGYHDEALLKRRINAMQRGA